MKLNVQGMTCQHCVRTITDALRAHDPDARVEVDLDAATVSVDGNLARTQVQALIEAAGYTVLADAAATKSCCGTCHA